MGHGLGVAADGEELAGLDGHGAGGGLFAVDRVEAAVEQDQIGFHVIPRGAGERGAATAGEGQGGPEGAGGAQQRARGQELATALVGRLLVHGVFSAFSQPAKKRVTGGMNR
ncbi:hypothetical protein FQZ97_945000 [compost metagenome]